MGVSIRRARLAEIIRVLNLQAFKEIDWIADTAKGIQSSYNSVKSTASKVTKDAKSKLNQFGN